MKIRFLTDYTAPDGFTFECGWTAEVADPDGARLVSEGVCIEMPPDTRARRLAPEAPPVAACTDPQAPSNAKAVPLPDPRKK